MKYHLNRKLIYLVFTDLILYLASTILFFSSFYAPITDVLEQAYNAIQENTNALSQSNDPLTSQISLVPHVQLLITYLLLFIALAAILGILAEFIKTKIIYKKPFWLKTLALQVGQLAVFIIMLSLTQYLLYIQFAIPLIPLWLMVALIAAIWALFFWTIAHSKAYFYIKRKYDTQTLWMSIALIGLFTLLLSLQIIELAILAAILWLVGWNWLQMYIAKA